MNALLNILETRGCEVKAALDQFGGNVLLYTKQYKQFIAGQCFEALGKAVSRRDADDAYTRAKAIRDDTMALGLTPLTTLLTQMATPLRAGSCNKAVDSLYKKLMVQVKVYRILAIRDGADTN